MSWEDFTNYYNNNRFEISKNISDIIVGKELKDTDVKKTIFDDGNLEKFRSRRNLSKIQNKAANLYEEDENSNYVVSVEKNINSEYKEGCHPNKKKKLSG